MDFSEFEIVEFDRLEDDILLNRKEIKFYFSKTILPSILKELHDEFDIVSFNKDLIQEYHSVYYDSSYRHYLDHHNKRKNRYKIRFRNYKESNLWFLEIKHKQNNGVTLKQRIEIPSNSINIFHPRNQAFLNEFYPRGVQGLEETISTSYFRSSFISKSKQSRITIDTNLSLMCKNQLVKFDELVVLELKFQSAFPYHTFRRMMKDYKIFPESISKYCLGICYLKQNVKKNNFKQKLTKIESIKQPTYAIRKPT